MAGHGINISHLEWDLLILADNARTGCSGMLDEKQKLTHFRCNMENCDSHQLGVRINILQLGQDGWIETNIVVECGI